MNQFLNTGIIPEAVYATGNPVQQLSKEILDGRTSSFSRKEIERIIDRRYFSFDSLVLLSKREKSFLRRDMTNDLLCRFNEGRMRKFLGSDCYQSTCRSGDGAWHIYAGEVPANDRHFSYTRAMTAEEKLAFLENPENLETRWHESWGSTSFARMGYRSISEYGMPRNRSFTNVIRRLQAKIGRKELHVLDLGGGVGLALDNIKKMHPELVTYNATRDEEFCCYPSDFHIVGFMERMPLALQGKIDFIFSNMTTRYLAYSDLVIQCCVLMLARGGIMNIFFSSERSDNHCEEDVQCRMKKAYDYLRNLKQSGMIQLKINHGYTSCVGGSFKSDAGSLYPAANVFVKKL